MNTFYKKIMQGIGLASLAALAYAPFDLMAGPRSSSGGGMRSGGTSMRSGSTMRSGPSMSRGYSSVSRGPSTSVSKQYAGSVYKSPQTTFSGSKLTSSATKFQPTGGAAPTKFSGKPIGLKTSGLTQMGAKTGTLAKTTPTGLKKATGTAAQSKAQTLKKATGLKSKGITKQGKTTGLKTKTPGLTKTKGLSKINKQQINKASKHYSRHFRHGGRWWNNWGWNPWIWGGFGLWGGYLYGSYWGWGWGWGGCDTCCDTCSPWIIAGPSICTGCAAPEMVVMGDQSETFTGSESQIAQRLEQMQQQIDAFRTVVEKEITQTSGLLEQLQETQDIGAVNTYLDERIKLLADDLQQTKNSITRMEKTKDLKNEQKTEIAKNLNARITSIKGEINTIAGLQDTSDAEQYLQKHLTSLQKDARTLETQEEKLLSGETPDAQEQEDEMPVKKQPLMRKRLIKDMPLEDVRGSLVMVN